MYPDAAVFFHRDFGNLRDVTIERKMSGYSARVSLRKRSAPMRFFHREIEHGKHPRLIRQKSAAKLVRILPARVSYFIQERFHRKSGVRMAHGAPPLHRHFI